MKTQETQDTRSLVSQLARGVGGFAGLHQAWLRLSSRTAMRVRCAGARGAAAREGPEGAVCGACSVQMPAEQSNGRAVGKGSLPRVRRAEGVGRIEGVQCLNWRSASDSRSRAGGGPVARGARRCSAHSVCSACSVCGCGGRGRVFSGSAGSVRSIGAPATSPATGYADGRWASERRGRRAEGGRQERAIGDRGSVGGRVGGDERCDEQV